MIKLMELIYAVAGLSVLTTISPAANPAPPMLAVAVVGSPIEDRSTIGSLKAGVACLPAGKLRWSDFVQDRDRNATRIAAVLTTSGLSAAASDPAMDDGGDGPVYRVTAQITALTADLCRPHYNWLKFGKVGLKGKGTMTVRWRVRDLKYRKPLTDILIQAEFAFQSPDRAFDAAIAAGLAANSKRVAPELVRLVN